MSTEEIEVSVEPASAAYLKWIEKFPLRPICKEEQNDSALIVLRKLMKLHNQEALDADSIHYMNVLSMLIRAFEQKAYDTGPPLTPEEVLAIGAEADQ